MREVAAAAGVSTATVSRALSDPVLVGLEVGERIRRLAKDLGYVRNGAAGALSSSRSRLLGVLTPAALDEGHAAMLAAIQASLAAADYASLVLMGPTREGFHRILSAGVEGIALLGASISDEMLELATARGLAVADVGEGQGPRPVSEGDLDLTRGAATVAAYLSELGHRRFGLIGAREPWGIWSDCTKALEAALGERADTVVLQAPAASFDFDVARDRVQEWLQQPMPPTAIICSDDLLAAGAVRGCASAGVSVPGDVSVVGVGDFAWSRHGQPALTTLRLPWKMAAQGVAARLLAARACVPGGAATLAERAQPAARLVVRGTSAPLSGIRGTSR